MKLSITTQPGDREMDNWCLEAVDSITKLLNTKLEETLFKAVGETVHYILTNPNEAGLDPTYDIDDGRLVARLWVDLGYGDPYRVVFNIEEGLKDAVHSELNHPDPERVQELFDIATRFKELAAFVENNLENPQGEPSPCET